MKHFKTISEFHDFRNMPKPLHPLLSVINVADIKHLRSDEPLSLVFDFYCIAVKRVANMKVQYGEQLFDFNEGILSFMAPNQVISIGVADKNEEIKQSGSVIYIHPDFFWNTPLAKKIKQYDFWSYSLHEALFLYEKEEALINNVIRNIDREYQDNMDRFSKQIITAQIETLFSYSERFYNRQFITREKANHHVLNRFEELLDNYFNDPDKNTDGVLNVQQIAMQLRLSPKYLTNLLRVLTGQNTQQHIHEHLQSFSKLFK